MKTSTRRIMTIAAGIIAIVISVGVCVVLGLVVFSSGLSLPTAPLPDGNPVENSSNTLGAAQAAAPVGLSAPTAIPTSDPLTLIAADPAATKDRHLVLRRIIVYNGMAIAEYDADSTAVGDNALLLNAGANLKVIAPRLLDASPDLTAVETCVWAPLKTAAGGMSSEVAIRLHVTRATASKIDWKSLDPTKLDSILVGKGDFVYLHPTLKAALPKVKAH